MFNKGNQINLANANNVYFKTFRCNRQESLDKLMHEFCANLPQGSKLVNESTSSFYIPLADTPQEIQKRNWSWSQANQNYLKANPVLQPIQFVGTLTYTKPNND